MQTFYIITLNAKVFRDTVDYTAFWDGQDFKRRPRNKFCLINNEDGAKSELKKIISSINHNLWGGRFKIELIAERYDNDNLLSKSVINSYQTQSF